MTAPTRIWRLPKVPLALTPYASQLSHWSFSPAAMGAMRTSRPAAEKLGAVRQDPDLDDLLFRLISRATGGRQEHAARADRPQLDDWGRTRVKEYGSTSIKLYSMTLHYSEAAAACAPGGAS